MEDFEIRPGKSYEESKSIWWPFMQRLGWNRGWYDLETYMNHSKSRGLLLIVQKSTDTPIGHVAAIINNNSTGWISMFIVDDAWQGQGLGKELFKAAMYEFELQGTEIVGLDGVVVQKATYERRGFVNSALGVIEVMTRPLVAKNALRSHETGRESEGILIDIKQVPQHLLVQHELKYTGFERRKLWTNENMFDRPDVLGFAVVSQAQPASVDDLLAWMLVRRCSDGFRLGPLYATNESSARSVLMTCMNACTAQSISRVPLPNEPMNDWQEDRIVGEASLVVEVWGGNPASLALFEGLGWNDTGVHYHRMWLNDKATPQQSKGGSAEKGLFAVFDAAIG